MRHTVFCELLIIKEYENILTVNYFRFNHHWLILSYHSMSFPVEILFALKIISFLLLCDLAEFHKRENCSIGSQESIGEEQIWKII